MFINTNFCHNFNPNKQLKEEKNNQNTGQILIFNRVPKCGSTMMISLLIRLAVRNNFNLFKSPVDSEELVDEAEFTNLLLGMGVNFDKLGEEEVYNNFVTILTGAKKFAKIENKCKDFKKTTRSRRSSPPSPSPPPAFACRERGDDSIQISSDSTREPDCHL